MTVLVETLKGLYQKKKIKGQQLRQMIVDKKITEEEYNYITSEMKNIKEDII